ncbi:MAG: hypothetical protein WBM50_13590 [Acidimicrobiales bacterium]
MTTSPGMIAGSGLKRGAPAAIGVVRSEVFERFRVLVVAGVTVGVLVVGVGSRLAMLLLRLTSPESVVGATSDDGFTIGRFTLGGTYNLLLLGASVGIIGAAAYRAVAPWLLGPAWFRRLTTAVASGAVVGSMLVHSDGVDFRLLKPLWLAIGLFVALPALFAVAIGLGVDRVASADSWTKVGRRRWALPLVLIAGFPLVLFIAVPALLVLAAWVPVRQSLTSIETVPLMMRVIIRSVWLAIAVAGLVALVRDVGELA